MNRFAWTVLAGIAIVGITSATACGDDSETAGPTGGGTCAPTNSACPALAVESACLGLVDNSGKDVFALRLSQLTLSAPQVLTTPVVGGIVAGGVNINLPSCNVDGDGTFSFITRFDRTTGKLLAGGAFPEEDPSNGYCFVNDPANNVQPVEVDSNLNADGSFSTDPLPLVTVPIYIDLTATSAVYLPLRNGRITAAKISADQNCIGSFNATGLQPANNCLPNLEQGIDYFLNDAELDGFITLEDADQVEVELLEQSLCVLLSGDPNVYGDGSKPNRCKRDGDGKIEFVGDWCSTTDSADGCKDSVKLAAKIAGSSVAVRDDCPNVPGTGGGGGSAGAGGANAGGGGGNAGGNGGAGGS